MKHLARAMVKLLTPPLLLLPRYRRAQAARAAAAQVAANVAMEAARRARSLAADALNLPDVPWTLSQREQVKALRRIAVGLLADAASAAMVSAAEAKALLGPPQVPRGLLKPYYEKTEAAIFDATRAAADAQAAAASIAGPPSHVGDFSSWAEAVAAAGGYDMQLILDIHREATREVQSGRSPYERDSVLFNAHEYFFPVLAALVFAMDRNGDGLTVLDFGGALGSSYWQNRELLSRLGPLQWRVVEQLHFAAAGRAEFENDELRFFSDLKSGWEKVPDLVLLSSVLQYLENPFALLEEISRRAPRFILVDRTPVLDSGRERIVVQTVPPSIYPASYACRLFAYGAIEAALVDRYDLRYAFEAHVGTFIEVDGARAQYRGCFFERKLDSR